MQDVSRLSGLSVYTVSRSLNGEQGVSEASRERVLAAAAELGYVPNGVARQLRRNVRSSIAVLTAGTSNNPYYLDLIRGIQSTVDAAGRRLIMADVAANGSYTRDAETDTVRNLIQSRVAGTISTLTLAKPSLKMLQEWDTPVVFVDSKPPAGSTFPAVTTDNIAAAKMVGEHLAGHGYETWLLLIYPSIWSSREDREHGIRLAAEAAGASLDLVETENNAAAAALALQEYTRRHPVLPRAIIAGNNPLALGALTFLRERQLAVPESVALIAYDEFDWSPLVNPSLTVVDEDSEQMGIRATRTLLSIIADQGDREGRGEASRPLYRKQDSQETTAQLRVRRSCGCSESSPPN